VLLETPTSCHIRRSVPTFSPAFRLG